MDIAKMEADFLQKKAESEIFDINFCITNHQDDLLAEDRPTPAEMLAKGISGLVLTDSWGRTERFAFSNEEVLQKAAENDAFYAAVTAAPEMNLAGADFAKTLDSLIARKAVIVRMFPKNLKHSMKKWQLGDMLRCMEARRIPLMLWHMQAAWDDIAEIAANYPQLPIIIEGSDQKTIYYVRDVMGLCEHFPNIYLELHNFTQYQFMPYALEHIGSHRLLFGSRTPFNDMNGVLYQIFTHANDAQQKEILSGSFKRLMAEIRR